MSSRLCFRLLGFLFPLFFLPLSAAVLTLREDASTHTLTVWREGGPAPILTQNAGANHRPYLHPIVAPDGRDDQVHLAVLDHPRNNGYPLPWRVEAPFGVGPSRGALGEWKIARSQRAAFRHQVIVHPGTFNDLQIDESWKAYSGAKRDRVLWNLAREKGKRAPFLTGEQAVARMTVPPGFAVKLTAAEPMITQPMAFCWDDRGWLWVAENRDYETRKSGFSNFGDSRIVILEDTDGDGKMDTRKVFLAGIPFPTAIARGFDGLWLGAPPNLLFVPDRNHDDVADADLEVRLTGWGIQDRHETMNSLNWGPDGWRYGCQGYATHSRVGRPADGGRILRRGEPFPEDVKAKDPVYLDGGVWRYHPTKDRFEVVAHGFSNPWGLDFDDHGQLFATACVIPHLWHVIPGGIYHRQGGQHINPYVFDDIKTIADHRHRSAHGGARIYLADAFPPAYRGRIFMANLHERALLTDILEAQGSGFVGHHGNDALLANDPQWIGFSVELGPDGAVYVLDWHDGDICGNSVLNKDTGRIFRFAPTGLPGTTGLDLAALDDLALVKHQLNPNDWYVRRARLLLQQRAAEKRLDPRVPEALWAMFDQQPDTGRKLRALWALHVTGHLPADRLLPLLDHPAPYICGWAIPLLGEDLAPGADAVRKFSTLARDEASPVVRLYLAAALQRLPLAGRWALAQGLVMHAEDGNDPNLLKMIWYGLEPLVMADPSRARALATRSRLPLVSQFIARRATAGKQLAVVVAAVAAAADATVRHALLEGLRDGLGSFGRRELSAPENWVAVERTLRAIADASLRTLAQQISQLFGDAHAAAAQLAALRDGTTPLDRRREILRDFARDRYDPALATVLELLDTAELRRDAARALTGYNDPRVATALLQRYAAWPAADRAEAVLALAARRSTAASLLRALQAGKIPRSDISASAARQLQRVIGPGFVDFWGQVAQPAEDKQADLVRYKRLLTDDHITRANVANGRTVFERTCAPCHTLYGAGGLVGPDLTGSNRANLDYILGEIINPSDVIQEGYQLVTLTTRDGRTLAGNLAGEDDQQVTLRLIGQETVVAKSAILSREKSHVSMMPEGLLKTLADDDVRDLIAYLRTTRQVAVP